MNIFIVYLLVVSTITPISETLIPNFYLHRIANAITKMRAPLDSETKCINNTSCLKIEICLHGFCRDPCPGSCGINAYCDVANHTMSCSCPRCYGGDAYKRCTPFRGFKHFMCQFGRFIHLLGGV